MVMPGQLYRRHSTSRRLDEREVFVVEDALKAGTWIFFLYDRDECAQYFRNLLGWVENV